MNILVEEDSSVLKDWCELCLRHKLYVKGRMAKEWFECPEHMLKMSLLDYKSSPVGWAMLYQAYQMHYNNLPVLGVYVMPPFRKKGYGAKLVKSIVENFDVEIYVDPSIKFFKHIPELHKVKV